MEGGGKGGRGRDRRGREGVGGGGWERAGSALRLGPREIDVEKRLSQRTVCANGNQRKPDGQTDGRRIDPNGNQRKPRRKECSSSWFPLVSVGLYRRPVSLWSWFPLVSVGTNRGSDLGVASLRAPSFCFRVGSVVPVESYSSEGSPLHPCLPAALRQRPSALWLYPSSAVPSSWRVAPPGTVVAST